MTQTTTEINRTRPLGLFDSNLGTLTSATIDLFGAATFNFSGTNNSAQGQRANITSSTDLFFSTGFAPLSPFLSAIDLALSASSGFQAYEPSQTRVFGPFGVSASDSADLSSILAALSVSGGGSFDVTCSSLSGLSVLGGGGNISTTQATTAGCGGRITYVFDQAPPPLTVPGPGSVALIGLALAGMGVARRKAKKS